MKKDFINELTEAMESMKRRIYEQEEFIDDIIKPKVLLRDAVKLFDAFNNYNKFLNKYINEREAYLQIHRIYPSKKDVRQSYKLRKRLLKSYYKCFNKIMRKET